MTSQTTQSLFEYATRNKLRFASVRGELTVEQLWDVPLRSRDDLNLNAVAKAANKALKDSEDSFVEPTQTPEHARRAVALEVVKHVIDTKVNEEKAAAEKADKKKKKEALLTALAEKEAGEMSAMSKKELLRQIEALSAE